MSADPALVSIVVPTRGGRGRLPRLVAALLAQTDPRWEAIVVVDGDTDDSEGYLRGVDDPRVRSIVLPENRGRVVALNTGFAAAHGDILVRCDDDLEPRPDHVAQRRQLHSDRAPLGIIGLAQNVYPATPYSEVYGSRSDAGLHEQAYTTPPERTWQFWGGNVSVTREAYDAVGGYDPDYRAYGWEDVDFGYRLHLAGVPVVIAPEVEAPHHVAATTTAIRVRRAFYSGAARRTFETKHGASALGHIVPPKGVWGAAVRFWTLVGSERVLVGAGATADRLIPILPSYVAHKLVALLVESAHLAGRRREVSDTGGI